MGKIFLLFLTIFWKLLVNQVQSDQVVIFDTTQEEKLEWLRFPQETPTAAKAGWKEESTFYKDKNVPAYAVCDVDNQNADNWLMLPKIDKGPANRLYIEIHFTMKNCSEFSSNNNNNNNDGSSSSSSSSSTCSESFSILSHETDNTAESDNIREMFQNEIDRIRVGNEDEQFMNKLNVKIHGVVKSFAVTKPNVYLAIRDQGSCTTILAVKIYYLACPEIILSLASFNKTVTGSNVLDSITEFGVCIENAEAKELPYSFCSTTGLWDLTKGCECKLGYEAKEYRSKCEICRDGTFRSKDIQVCTKCPPNSVPAGDGADQCPCIEGHKRHSMDGRDMPCLKPSRAPINVTAKSVNQTFVTLSWDLEDEQKNEFISDEFIRTIVFQVECLDCDGNVVFEKQTLDMSITINDLTPASNYTFRIHAFNGPSNSIKSSTTPRYTLKDLRNQSNDSSSSEIKFTTTPPIITIEKVQITSNEIALEWENPLPNNTAIEKFELRYYLISDTFVKEDNFVTSETKAKLTGLEENTKYGIQIRCGTYHEWGPYSNIVYANTLKNTNTN